jgi:peptidoglycan/xylan/chitin deacetylase (PgdA/CDA1 family)
MYHIRIWVISVVTVVAIPAAIGLGQGPVSKSADADKEICITFDDLPVVRVHDPNERMQITKRLLTALDTFGVTAAGFVVGGNIAGGEDLLRMWLARGHTLGNHTFNHPDLSELPLALYLKDFEKGHDAIEGLLTEAGQRNRYFRPPQLHYGPTVEIRDSLMAYLAGRGYVLAHVTVDNDDYLYNKRYEELSAGSDSAEIPRLGREFVEHIRKQIDSFETLADRVAGRPVRQILLLHANRLNGRFLPDLLAMIKGKGYRFIPLDSALADPIYRQPDLYAGRRGISFLERLNPITRPQAQDGLKPPGR